MTARVRLTTFKMHFGGPYRGYTEKTVILRYFGQKSISTPQIHFKSCQAHSGRHFERDFELF